MLLDRIYLDRGNGLDVGNCTAAYSLILIGPCFGVALDRFLLSVHGTVYEDGSMHPHKHPAKKTCQLHRKSSVLFAVGSPFSPQLEGLYMVYGSGLASTSRRARRYLYGMSDAFEHGHSDPSKLPR